MDHILRTFLWGFGLLLAAFLVFIIADVVRNFSKQLNDMDARAKINPGLGNSKKKQKKEKRYRGDLPDDFFVKGLDEEDEGEKLLITEGEGMPWEQEGFEEYETKTHECLVCVHEDSGHMSAVCAFRGDREVEFFSAALPECCTRNGQAVDAPFRAVMAAARLWGDKWVYAEAVTILCQDRMIVKAFNTPGTRHHRMMQQFQRKFEFQAYVQWSDNFVCDDGAQEDFWESLVDLTKQLNVPKLTERKQSRAWKAFPIEHWHRTRRQSPSEEDFHQVAHAGNGSNNAERAAMAQEKPGVFSVAREGKNKLNARKIIFEEEEEEDGFEEAKLLPVM